MKISVIIPVYNAEVFIENAVKSAHHFDCVDEIIIVEDGSADNSLMICTEIINKYPKTKLFTHLNNENKGAGATRNLGILKTKNEWISFLDADDFYLNNRFDKEEKLFKLGLIEDGVYGALGIHYYDSNLEKRMMDRFGKGVELTTISSKIQSHELIWVLLGLHPKTKGYFHLDTLTVKKKLLLDVNLFNPILRLHQDTDLILKLSYKGKLVTGECKEPIGMRGIHNENRITNNKNIYKTRYLFYKEFYFWSSNNIEEKKLQNHILNQYKYYGFLMENKSKNIFNLLLYTFKHPSIFFNKQAFSLFLDLSKVPYRIISVILLFKNTIVNVLLKKYYIKYITTYQN